MTAAGTVMRGKTVLGHEPWTPDELHEAHWVPAQRILVFHGGRLGHEGCEGTDPRGAAIVKLR